MDEIRSGGLIKGPPAFALLRLRYRCTTAALAVLGIVLILNVSGVPQSWFTNSVVAAVGVAMIPVIVLIIWVPVKAQAEQEAGYTTLRNELKDLEQRDPYLGRVIRNPGEEHLQRADFLAIIQAAKQEAESLSGTAHASSARPSTGGTE
ncbi:hypothetical protein [Arthrobacter sp. FW306-2-2C-D06B]|uniref:hypothetical protein n=1 Tax=Arthrobacter sp. FW306-2-2C-D06B TaxID=2879618 RepID=UPI001F30B8E4|nr:hypothetical protein [Arthrobacter sp. FW306-2-2C-D06B]UKA59393.1 hypothetical protein LFT47_03310 [Arthrobacter sp. FW306-2-2C-D06B]